MPCRTHPYSPQMPLASCRLPAPAPAAANLGLGRAYPVPAEGSS